MANDLSPTEFDNAAVLGVPEKTPRKARATQTEKVYKIRINTDPNDERPVQVAVQGVQFLIARGEEVEVPERVVEVLRNAVELRYRRNKDGEMEPYEHPAYSFQIIGS